MLRILFLLLFSSAATGMHAQHSGCDTLKERSHRDVYITKTYYSSSCRLKSVQRNANHRRHDRIYTRTITKTWDENGKRLSREKERVTHRHGHELVKRVVWTYRSGDQLRIHRKAGSFVFGSALKQGK